MQVEMTIKSWSVEKDKKTGIPKIVGRYAISAMGKELATQNFNDGYDSKELPFSGDLIKELIAIEEKVVKEVQALIK